MQAGNSKASSALSLTLAKHGGGNALGWEAVVVVVVRVGSRGGGEG